MPSVQCVPDTFHVSALPSVTQQEGCEQSAAVDIAEFLQARRLRPQQVQDFIPTPGTPATCMWWTGLDPTRMKEVFVENKMRNKRKQRAMLQWWKPENAPLVKELLQDTGRTDLIGGHEGALIPDDRMHKGSKGTAPRKKPGGSSRQPGSSRKSGRGKSRGR